MKMCIYCDRPLNSYGYCEDCLSDGDDDEYLDIYPTDVPYLLSNPFAVKTWDDDDNYEFDNNH